ncbi:recombinase family protein [Arthrobacter oryzae]|uniref:Resolvase/invertase-type recombinase catalytic domain-containing protein n=1 Tax=Arthrobacter oryzae TaxID=409290 RepID=A0A3N0C0A6_9MICC|nr:hypothetical protein D7003_09385 [Arthrobacter oryzae]
MAVVGYARVSTTDQNLDLQFTALQAVGAARTFPGNGVSGSTVERPQLSASASWTSSRTSGTGCRFPIPRGGRGPDSGRKFSFDRNAVFDSNAVKPGIAAARTALNSRRTAG